MFGFGKQRCPFCHERVSRRELNEHIERHTRRLPDGQQEDHITEPPEKRFTGTLEGVPQVYSHWKCGDSTVMPEDIIRSYLANPFLYNESTYCAGCEDYVHQSELRWEETNERLDEYFDRLRREHHGH